MKKITSVLALVIFASQVLAQNVGINTSNPKATLDLNGNMRMQPTILVVAANALTLPAAKGNIILTGTSTGPITLHDSTGAEDGTIIIITNNCGHAALLEDKEILPGKKVVFILTNGKYRPVEGGAGWGLGGNANTDPATHFIGTTGNTSLSFRTQNTERMRLANNGLEMANEIKPNGVGGTQNQVLKNNGNGTMAWANASTATGSAGFGSWGDCATNANIGEYNPVAMDDGNARDGFGFSVSIDGDYAIIGVPYDDGAAGANQGSASIYRLAAGVWTFQTKLLNSAAAANDYFGRSVSIHGHYAIVGAWGDDDDAGTDQGSVSIYSLIAGIWTFDTKLFNSAAAAGDEFGINVCIHGNYAIVGAYGDDDATGADQGSASIYRHVDGVWTFQQKFLNTAASANGYFGISVSINSDYAIVGATNANQGSASIYKRLGNSWRRYQYIVDPSGTGYEFFGGSVAIDAANKRFLIGDYLYNGSMGKAVFGKIN